MTLLKYYAKVRAIVGITTTYASLMISEKEISAVRGKGTVPEYRDIFPPNISNIYDDELVSLIGEANRAISNLNSYARIVPNPDLLIGPMLLREAISSSRIEGTQATVRDILRQDVDIELPGKVRAEAREIVNHREATKLGLLMLEELPISNRMLKGMHKRLMYRVRGEAKRRGDFRMGSNAVATENTVDSIRFLPPPASEVENLMFRLEEYINQPSPKIDPLIRCALIHYEFEAIHPFADGNGRLGRVLISLFLIKESVLEYPLLYLSGYLLRERKLYDALLLRITTKEGWKPWLEFFLRGIKEQALGSKEILERIYSLHRRYEDITHERIKSRYAIRLVELIFKRPIITAPRVARSLGVRHTTAMSLLKKMANLGLLRVDTTKKRNIPFYNEELITLVEV